jgi:hypothetical protein
MTTQEIWLEKIKALPFKKLTIVRQKVGQHGDWFYGVNDENGNPMKGVHRTSKRDYLACCVLTDGTLFGAPYWCGRFDLVLKGDSGKAIEAGRCYGIAIREDSI